MSADRIHREPRSILLVDDDPIMREYCRSVLGPMGYTVDEAADGEDAILRAQSNPGGWTAVLLDMVLPRMTGREVLPVLRHLLPDTPILLYTAYERDELEPALFDDARVGHVGKPLDVEALESELATLLSPPCG